MTIASRGYRGEKDFYRVRQLLIESYAITHRIPNWWLDRSLAAQHVFARARHRTRRLAVAAWLPEPRSLRLHPAYQRRGLAKAMMCEGLRRLQALGAAEAYVGVGSGEAANRLYESAGFTDAVRDFHWQKTF